MLVEVLATGRAGCECTGRGSVEGDMSPTAFPNLVICRAALTLSKHECTPAQCKGYI